MTGWLTFAGAFALFFATHSIPVRPPVKRRLVQYIGARGFTLAYSVLSLVMLALLIGAARQAPAVTLWSEAVWHRPVVWVGMALACVIAALAIGRPNPFSFGGAVNHRFDPRRPGIVGFLRHPLLVALALWAGLHLLANGDLAHVLLFGTLGVFAIAGRMIVDRRCKRALGADQWAQLLFEARQHRQIRSPSRDTALRIGAGLLVFAMLVALHPAVIGRPVFI